MKNYKLFTHTDLDGVACAIVARLFLEEIDVEYCTNSSIDKKLEDFLKERINDYKYILITDLPISKEVAEKIQEKYKEKVRLLDHHSTEKSIGEYEWAEVKVNTGEYLHCGAELLYQYLLGVTHRKSLLIHERFVELVRLYDTWEWEKVGNLEARELNYLLSFEGIFRFAEEMEKKLSQQLIFTEQDKQVIEILQENKEQYIKRKSKQIISIEAKGYKIGVIFGEQYISELGNDLADMHPELDLIAIFTGRKISLRSNKADINLGEWSKEHFGGGGHAQSAGMMIEDEKLTQIAQLIFGQSGLS